MQDSFYITSEYLLRTQTSAVQARTMMANTEKTPIRVICPGKTYRKEDDATHSHQLTEEEYQWQKTTEELLNNYSDDLYNKAMGALQDGCE